MSTITRPPLHRWNYADWDRMIGSGLLDRQRVELIDGEIIQMSPQYEPHVAGIILSAGVMRRLFHESAHCVRSQAPLRLGHDSEPEPDVAVVQGTIEDYLKSGHPTTALLIIEVAQSSLDFDRGDKASLYASAGVADYWIVNLIDGQLEVHRNPIVDANARFGHRYGTVIILKPGEFIAPLAATDKSVAVADLWAQRH
jgi:Uma2 family endonuclease